MRKRVHDLLAHDPGGAPGWNHRLHLMISALIVFNVVAMLLEMDHGIHDRYRTAFHVFDMISVSIFATEWLLRLWSSAEDPRYADGLRGRLRYAVSPLMVADLLALSHFILPLFITVDLRFLRLLRLMHIIRLYAEARSGDP